MSINKIQTDFFSVRSHVILCKQRVCICCMKHYYRRTRQANFKASQKRTVLVQHIVSQRAAHTDTGQVKYNDSTEGGMALTGHDQNMKQGKRTKRRELRFSDSITADKRTRMALLFVPHSNILERTYCLLDLAVCWTFKENNYNKVINI